MKLVTGTRFRVWTGIGLSLALVLAALVALGASNRPATAASPSVVSTVAAANKITTGLRAAFKNSPNGQVRYLAVLTTQADTSNTITDWNAKGRYVLDTLRNVANSTQPPVAAALGSLKATGSVASFKSYYIINAFQVRGNAASAAALAALPGIARLDEFPVAVLDESAAPVAPASPSTIEWNVNIIHAPQAWAMGYNGAGVTVGSLDTGARYTHNAIVAQYRGNLGGGNFNHNYNWWPAVGSSTSPVDSGGADSYHGSHTIGTILGDDGGTNQIGVAPGANWIASNGIASPALDPDIIEAGQWMLAPYDLNGQNPDPSKRPAVVSNSWGYGNYGFSCSGDTFFRTVVQSWVAAGIFASYSSGNGGTAGNRIPGAYPETFETGSINSAFNISSFSSRGPSCFDGSQEPQVVAGGENVRSVDGAGDTGYKFLSGTSMSQPAVAGAVAVLKQANPNLTIAQTWFILTSTAVFSPSWGTRPNSNYGWGLIQLDAAVQAALQLGGTPTPTRTGTPPTATPTRTPLPPSPTATCVGGGGSSWTVGPSLSTTNIRGAGVVYPGNGRFYVLGGRVDDNPGSDNQSIFEYNPGTNSWATKAATLPTNRTNNGVGAVMTLTGTQYVVFVGGSNCCGATALSTGDVRLYNPTADTLVTLGTDPWPGGAISSTLPGGGAVYNNKLYIFGGFDITGGGTGVVDTIWEMDPSRPAGSRWVLKNAHLPTALGYVPVATIGSYIYTGGGATFSGSLADSNLAYRYDPVADTISALPTLPNATSNTKGIAFNGQLWVLGGGFTAPNPTNMVQAYDPGTNAWTNPTSYVNARRNQPADTDGTHIYMVGGYVSGAPGSDMEIYGPAGGCGGSTPSPTVPATVTPPPQATSTATATPIPTTCPIQFNDVPVGSTFYDFVRCLACRGIVGGYVCGGPGEPCPGNYFRPNNNVTRGQVSKIVSESAGFAETVPSTQWTFQDVPPSGTFWLWVERLSGRGIIGGYACGSNPFEPCVAPGNRPYFRPNNDVTRGQLSKIVSGAAGWTETPTGQTFQDVAVGSTFYVYVERVASRGIVSGYPCGGVGEPCVAPGNRPYFRPFNNATRGQMSKIAASAFFPGCSTPAQRH